MNAFQRRCGGEVERVLAGHGLDVELVELDGRYLRAELAHRGRLYEIYVYEDGAGVKHRRHWHILELRQFSTPDRLTAAFGRFLDRCLAGEDPADALDAAR